MEGERVVAMPNDVLGFWRNAGPSQWYAANARFDAALRLKFEPVHHAAARGEYDKWAATPDGALALLIVLDQFPRNLFRRSAHAFATDPKARAIAREATEQGWHMEVEPELRQFMILPFEHSEDIADQDLAITLAEEVGDAEILKWVVIHRDIISRFGRFPHRNAMLGRTTTAEEQAFLDDGGFAG
jgi:uncharacterized protein (DUF924 family)